jgi:hypothetical protein
MSASPRPADRGRFSSRREADMILPLLRGESLEILCREWGLRPRLSPAGAMTGWSESQPPWRR